MLRMDGFDYQHASSPEAAVDLFHARPGSVYVAGGTDLLPNIKHRIIKAQHVIGLATALPQGWEEVADEASPSGRALRIGAGTRLSRLARCEALPALATAAGLVAGPQIRNMGTLGGNVLLDTRCLFYNQTEFWRKSLGYCLKAEGDWCHVVGGPKTCVATQSSDTVPVLLAQDASVRLLGPDGERWLRLRELYRFDGKDHLKIAPGEVLTHVRVPLPGPAARSSYHKVRTRGSIDFPQLSVAIFGDFEGAVPRSLEIVIGAVNPAPKPVRGLEAFLGRALDGAAIAEIAEVVHKQTRPQGSVAGDTSWRRHMASVTVRRGLEALAAGA